MFSKLFDLFRPVHFEEITNARLHAIVHEEVERLLAPKGFEAVGALKWVNGQHAPIRQMFALNKWKGGTVAPRWGVSLDFVPHMVGSKIRWHRSNKTAKFDLNVDPRDKSLEMSYINGERPIRAVYGRVLAAGIEQAMAFWAQCETVSALPAAIAWLKNFYDPEEGPNFYTYTQHPLAVAFVLARIEHTEEALAELDRLSSDLWRVEMVQPLKDLIQFAKPSQG